VSPNSRPGGSVFPLIFQGMFCDVPATEHRKTGKRKAYSAYCCCAMDTNISGPLKNFNFRTSEQMTCKKIQFTPA